MNTKMKRKLCNVWIYLTGFIPLILFYEWKINLQVRAILSLVLSIAMIIVYKYGLEDWSIKEEKK